MNNHELIAKLMGIEEKLTWNIKYDEVRKILDNEVALFKPSAWGNINHQDRLSDVASSIWWPYHSWSASIDGTQDGEMTPEVRRWVAENVADVWEEYVSRYMITYNTYPDDIPDDIETTIFTRMLNTTLSLSNLCHYLIMTVKEWAYGECPYIDEPTGGVPCHVCHGTGKVAIPRFDEVRKFIEEGTK